MRDTIPRLPWRLFSLVGPRAYARYAERLRGASRVAPRSDQSGRSSADSNAAVIAEFRANSGSVTQAMGGAT
jgi:hypothetical protein